MTLLRTFERIFIVCVFLAMVALFFLNVLAREIGGTFASEFAWIEEAVRLMNLFLVFGAIGLALERGRHVGISALRSKLRPILRKPLRMTIDIFGLFFTGYLCWLGWQMVQFVLNTGQRSPTLDIPMGWVYMAPLVGFGLLALRYAMSLFNAIDRFTDIDANEGSHN